MKDLKCFMLNTMIIISWVSLSLFILTSSYLEKSVAIQWFYIIVPPNLAIVLVWSYWAIVKSKRFFVATSDLKRV